ncbi:MAG: hypothetical protein RR997_06380, partial [Raoultibacter sp.]
MAEETLGKKRMFKIEKLPECTDAMRIEFAESLKQYASKQYDHLSIAYYEKYCAPNERPITLADYIEIDSKLKEYLDAWLSSNALRYGYKYTKIDPA